MRKYIHAKVCTLLHQQLLNEQVREKTDKFQQRRLDGFFKAGAKAADEGNAVEEAELPAMPAVMAMEIEMEVRTPPSAPYNADPVSLLLQTQPPSHCRLGVLSMQTRCPFQCRRSVPFNAGC